MARYKDIYIDQGSLLSKQIPVTGSNGLPVDITGFQARGQIRKHWSSKTAQNFLTQIDDPTSGIIYVALTAEQTGGLKPGRFMYDIEIYTDVNGTENVIRILEGQAIVLPRITRSS